MSASPLQFWPEFYDHSPAVLDAAAITISIGAPREGVSTDDERRRFLLALELTRRTLWQPVRPRSLSPLMQVALAGMLHTSGARRDDALAQAMIHPTCWALACLGESTALAEWCRRTQASFHPESRLGQIIDRLA